MTTLLQLVLLLSLIVGIVGGCGMEMPYIIVTAMLIKSAWVVISWWRTFQHERDNRWLHRRLAYGAAMILALSISQFALTYFVGSWDDEAWSDDAVASVSGQHTSSSFAPAPGHAAQTSSGVEQIRLIQSPHSRRDHLPADESITTLTMEF